MWFISAAFSPAWGWLPRKIPVPGPALHPIGVLSKVMAARIALTFCKAPQCGLQGEQERTQGCEIQAGICLSSQGKDEGVSSTILQKWSLIQSQNLTLPLRGLAVWGSKNTCWQGPKRESEVSPTMCWKGSFSVFKRPVPQTENLLRLSHTSVSSPCQSLVGSSSTR